MVKVACPMPGCSFETDDQEPAVVAVLLQIHGQLHSSESRNSSRDPKMNRPRIDTGADQESWNTFLRRWENFRVGSNIRDCTASVQLLQCAGDELSEMLLKTDPEISSRHITEVLSAMKSFAVIPVAIGIVRDELMQMHQANDESFRSFAAKVRGKAETGEFIENAKCPCGCEHTFPFDYTAHVIRDVLLAGIGCSDIKREVLSMDGIHAKTTNELIGLVEQREMARNALSRRQSVVAAVSTGSRESTSVSLSTFKRHKTMVPSQASPRVQPSEQTTPCPVCGGTFHPYRKFKNGWNKKPFKECLSCWRAGRRTARSNVNLQNAECAISQASSSSSVSRISAGRDHEESQRAHHPQLSAGNAYLSSTQ